MAKTRNYNLDLIKILACVGTVCVHCIDGNSLFIVRVVYHSLGFPIPFFFMAGGFFLLNKKSVNYSYSLSKIWKFFKIAFIWSCIVVFIRSITEIYHGNFSPLNLLTVINVLLNGLLVRGKLFHFWYLGTLMIIYLLLPIIYRYKEHIVSVWLVCLIVGTILQYASYFLHFSIQQKIPQTFRLWCYLQYFILGGLIGSGRLDKLWQKPTLFVHFLIVIILTAFCISYRMCLEKLTQAYFFELFYDAPIFVLWIFCTFTLILRIPLSDVICKIIGFLSSFIMGVYLVHPLIINVGVEVFGISVFTLYSAKSLILYFVSVLSISFAVSYVIKQIPVVRKVIEV